jgi:hypothetical protein
VELLKIYPFDPAGVEELNRQGGHQVLAHEEDPERTGRGGQDQ